MRVVFHAVFFLYLFFIYAVFISYITFNYLFLLNKYNFYIIFLGVLKTIFKLLEEVRFEIIASRKEQQEIKIKLDALLTQNKNSTINKFSRLLPISSMESFDEIDQCLTNSEEDFISLVKI